MRNYVNKDQIIRAVEQRLHRRAKLPFSSDTVAELQGFLDWLRGYNGDGITTRMSWSLIKLQQEYYAVTGLCIGLTA